MTNSPLGTLCWTILSFGETIVRPAGNSGVEVGVAIAVVVEIGIRVDVGKAVSVGTVGAPEVHEANSTARKIVCEVLT